MFSTSTNHPVTPVNLPPQIVSISSISIHLRKTGHLRVVTLLQMLDAASEGTLSVAKVLWGELWMGQDIIETFPLENWRNL